MKQFTITDQAAVNDLVSEKNIGPFWSMNAGLSPISVRIGAYPRLQLKTPRWNEEAGAYRVRFRTEWYYVRTAGITDMEDGTPTIVIFTAY